MIRYSQKTSPPCLLSCVSPSDTQADIPAAYMCAATTRKALSLLHLYDGAEWARQDQSGKGWYRSSATTRWQRYIPEADDTWQTDRS